MYEQKLILEIVFLLFYGRIKADATHYLSVRRELQETSWGETQACLPYFDDETSAINQNVSNLLTLIALQISHTEDICSPEFTLASDPTERQLTNPAKLKELYDLQLNLLEQQPQQAAPVALAWSFILHQFTTIYLETGIPQSHQDFAELILPQSNQMNSDLDDHANAEQQEENMPLYQRWARHVLSNQCQLFPHLSRLVTSVYCASSHGRFGSPDNNALGYLVTVRTFLSALPIFFRLSYLGRQQFEEAINLFGLLFRLDVQHAIASDLWRAVLGDLEIVSDVELPLATGEAEFLDSARVKIPHASMKPPHMQIRATSCLYSPMLISYLHSPKLSQALSLLCCPYATSRPHPRRLSIRQMVALLRLTAGSKPHAPFGSHLIFKFPSTRSVRSSAVSTRNLLLCAGVSPGQLGGIGVNSYCNMQAILSRKANMTSKPMFLDHQLPTSHGLTINFKPKASSIS